MYDGRRILAVIPARGGSKGLPGKNIRPLGGRPLIAWSIEAGLQSRFVDRVIVSTDSNEIADVARAAGAEVPFLRPPELATDDAKGVDAIIHAIDWYRGKCDPFDLVLVLQPTSPLRTPEDIDRAVELFFKKKACSVVSVCQTDHHPWWANTLPADGSMKDFLRPELSNTNRQNLPVFYRLNGAIYLTDISFLEQTLTFITAGTFAYSMPAERSVDIDSLLDFYLAEAILTEISQRSPSP